MALAGLDHLVLDVGPALDDAAATYRSLGFHLTERGLHTLGSSNHLAMFATNYLELLSAGPAEAATRRELVGVAPGVNGLVLATADADAEHRALRANAVRAREPQSFSRPVRLADGSSHDARFRTTHLAADEVPFGRLYFCQHDTRELVWRREWQDHPNGAQEIAGILISADAPAAPLSLFRRLGSPDPAPDGARVMAGTVAIEIATHAEAAHRLGEALPKAAGRRAFVAAVRLRTRSLPAAASVLGRAAVDGQVVVPAAAAGNVALVFAE